MRLRWGLVPSWSHDLSIGVKAINARSEGIASKPMFRAAFRKRRCLIPANAFYEWKKTGKAKQPFLIHPAGSDLMAFAGLWETWQGDESPVESFTVITTEANQATCVLHDRMPVILAPSASTNGSTRRRPRRSCSTYFAHVLTNGLRFIPSLPASATSRMMMRG